ncbi:MAG TPA: hypothetical protein DEA43_04615 [Candidatus Moranbacteria bacterium]|nr:hypothetical protein [Candidatus Moranbacteria bacterium]HBT46136.1 hypothetical protein [Candidatus Moranbacteria bacterium]
MISYKNTFPVCAFQNFLFSKELFNFLSLNTSIANKIDVVKGLLCTMQKMAYFSHYLHKFSQRKFQIPKKSPLFENLVIGN